MPVVVVVIVVLVVVVVVFRLRSHSATSSGPPVPPTDPDDDERVPTLDVVALGVSGSGKTVFLASMLRELQVQRAGRPYILEAETSQRVMLNAVYRQVTDPSAPWPLGTKVDETRQFEFTCSAFHDRTKHRIMRVRYLDYAGELFESARPDIIDDQAALEQHIKSAHALIGVIDGYRVLQLLRGEAEGRHYVDGAIDPMLGEMSSATCPIHFVVTKWDVLHGFGESAHASDEDRLARVRDALLAHTAIGDLVRSTSVVTRVVRLIPVSAVGPHFVRADASGIMRKQAGARISPTNVDVPFASILPDLFRQIEAAITEADRRAMDRYVRRAARLDGRQFLAAVARVVGLPTKLVLEAALGKAYGAYAVGLFFDWLGQPMDEQSERLERLRSGEAQLLADAQGVRSRVVRAFEDSVLKLEARLPSSNLSVELRL